MTSKELKTVLEEIDVSALSDKELEDFIEVVRPFYYKLRHIQDYLNYTDFKTKSHRRSFLNFFKRR